jgi:NADH:ubiquinone oxidoreductase subunit D
MDLGATSPFFYTFREREIILKYFEKVTGQRMMNNYFIFGGVRHDIFEVDEIKTFLKTLSSKLKDYEDLITQNPIFLKRTVNKGILESAIGFDYGITGVNLRASNVNLDFRTRDYLYQGFEFTPIVLDGKDSWTRYKARIMEIEESKKIALQAIEIIESNGNLEQNVINPLNLKLPEGEYSAEIESPRGLACCFIKSTGEKEPYRLKWRTGSYYAVNLLRKLLVGEYLNDAIAIAGSLDIILPEVDK